MTDVFLKQTVREDGREGGGKEKRKGGRETEEREEMKGRRNKEGEKGRRRECEKMMRKGWEKENMLIDNSFSMSHMYQALQPHAGLR